MKYNKAQIHSRIYSIPQLKFEDQRLTSFAGLVGLGLLTTLTFSLYFLLVLVQPGNPITV